jgi:HD superfamily phosphohydrolase
MTIRDAVHGDMTFDAVERAVFDAPPMQRLRGVKQLGMASLVFPSAVHTRFEHSLGAAWMAKRLLRSLEEARVQVEPDEARTAVLATLLHDVTHVPFGHTFEDERRLFDRHDEDVDRLDHFLNHAAIAEALDDVGQRDKVRNVLARRPDASPLASGIVAGAVGADLLDYLQRDAFFCGLALRYDERLFQLFSVVDGRLVVKLHKGGVLRRDALSELIHLLQMRYALTERVYYHHAKCAAGAMVSRVLELAMEAGRFTRDDLYPLRDDSLLHVLQTIAQDVPAIGEVVSDLIDRRLFKRVYFTTLASLGRPGLLPMERDALAAEHHYAPDRRRAAECRIAARLGVPERHVVIYCPSPTMALKEADVPVEIAPGVVHSLGELGHPDVEGLKQKHAGIWRFYVFMRRDHEALFQRAGDVSEEVVGHPNQR